MEHPGKLARPRVRPIAIRGRVIGTGMHPPPCIRYQANPCASFASRTRPDLRALRYGDSPAFGRENKTTR